MTEQPNATPPVGAVSAETTVLLQKYWTVDAIMLEWRKEKEALDACKEREQALRRAIFELKFPTPKEGTQRVELGNGYFLKAVYPMIYDCGKDTPKVEAALEELEKLGPEAGFVADRIIKWKPELSITEFRQLKPEYKVFIDKFLTIKPGSPQLEIEEPKA